MWSKSNSVGGFQGQQRSKYDPYSNTYNTGWRDHPNFSYSGNQQPFGNPTGFNQPRQQQPYRTRPSHPHNQGTPLEDIVSSLATNALQFQ